MSSVDMKRSATADRLVKRIDKKKSFWGNNNDWEISFGTKATTFNDNNSLGVYLINKQNVIVSESETIINELIVFIMDNCSKENESGDGPTEIGTTDIFDGFFQYIRIEDSLNCFIIKELPMKNYHFNDLIETAWNDKKNGVPISMIDTKSILESYTTHVYKNEYKQITYSVNMLQAMDEYISHKMQAKLTSLMRELAYNPEMKINYIHFIISAIIEDPKTWHIYEKILKHWMWCVKRRALGLSTIYQILPVFTGEQGTGKSTLINRLVSRFSDQTLYDAKLSGISEERSAAVDSAKLIWILDEMPFADKINIDKLKTWVTADISLYRPMGTNSSIAVKKLSMGIGSQNRPLGSVIQDSTGNRRFAPFPLKQDMNNYVDIFNPEHKYYDEFVEGGEAWNDIWVIVDENLERGYIDFNSDDNELSAIFNTNIKDSNEYQFYIDIFAYDKSDRITIRRSLLYEVYKKYILQTGNKSKGNNKFIHDFELLCKTMELPYNSIKNQNIVYCVIPKLNKDYKPLFETISDNIPGIKGSDGQYSIFHDEDLYIQTSADIVMDNVKFRTRESIKNNSFGDDKFKPERTIIYNNDDDDNSNSKRDKHGVIWGE